MQKQLLTLNATEITVNVVNLGVVEEVESTN